MPLLCDVRRGVNSGLGMCACALCIIPYVRLPRQKKTGSYNTSSMSHVKNANANVLLLSWHVLLMGSPGRTCVVEVRLTFRLSEGSLEMSRPTRKRSCAKHSGGNVQTKHNKW